MRDHGLSSGSEGRASPGLCRRQFKLGKFSRFIAGWASAHAMTASS